MTPSVTARPSQAVPAGPDVFYWSDPVVAAGPLVIAFLKAEALVSPRRRSRLCMHRDPSAAVHEMLIVHARDVYVRPHRHHGRAESTHCVEGSARVVVFADDGTIRDVIELGAGGAFYVRIGPDVFHALLIRSPWLIFHETTAGPFERANIEFAPWSAPDDDSAATAAYAARLERAADLFIARAAARTGA